MCIAEPPRPNELLREPPNPVVLLPPDPNKGPPLPRALNVRWPWQSAPVCLGWPSWDRREGHNGR